MRPFGCLLMDQSHIESMHTHGLTFADSHKHFRVPQSRVCVANIPQPGGPSFKLEPEKTEANLKDGVLTLHIPKRAELRPRRIEVRAV